MNLVGNAFKFTPAGGTVHVRVKAIDQAFMRCEIKDTGRGIGPKEQGQIFEAFTQVDMSNTRGAGGTGLGLTICKALVEAPGGAIGVESKLGEGATFWFTLPLEAATTLLPAREHGRVAT